MAGAGFVTRLLQWCAVAAFLGLLAACGGGGGEPLRKVATVTVSSATSTLNPGESVQLAALARDGAGEVVPGGSIVWSVSDPSVATISATGRLQALAGGKVLATATIGDARGWVALVVWPFTAESVTVTSPALSLHAGDAVQLGAVVRNQLGATFDSATATWSTSDSRVATVTPTGLLQALAPGSVVATATAYGASGALTLTVDQPLPAAYFIDGVEYAFDYQLDAQGRVQNYQISQRPGLPYALPPAQDAALVTCTGSLSGVYECRHPGWPDAIMRGEGGRLTFVARYGGPVDFLEFNYVYGNNGLISVTGWWNRNDFNDWTDAWSTQTLWYDVAGHLIDVAEQSHDCTLCYCSGRGTESQLKIDGAGRLQHADHAEYSFDNVKNPDETRAPTGTSATDWTYDAAGFMKVGVDSPGWLAAKPVTYASTPDGWLLSRTWSDGVVDEYRIIRSAAGITEEQFTQAEPSRFYERRAPQRVRYEWGRLPSEPLFVPQALTGRSGSDYFGIISSHQRNGGSGAPTENVITVFRDRILFQGQRPPNGHATFDDVSSGTAAPFVTAGVAVGTAGVRPAPAEVRSTLVGLPISSWFSFVGSSPNFLVTNAIAGAAVELTLPWSSFAIGFDIQCFACGSETLHWTLLDAAGTAVGSGETAVTWTWPTPLFFGLQSSIAFRSLKIEAVTGNWLMDNVQYRLIPTLQCDGSP